MTKIFINKTKYYNDIQELIPCFDHGIKLADLLRKLLHESIIVDCNKETLYFLSKQEVLLRESLNNSRNPNLNDHQLQTFLEVQRETLQFLEKISLPV
jgi:dsDNA-binding SOS-regulon protein